MKITITLTEKEILSLVEIISRKDEISKPTLMYENYLSSVDKKIKHELDDWIEGIKNGERDV